jgi:hypothetical protein
MNLEFLDPCVTPPVCGRYLAYCAVKSWTGLVDVYYTRDEGWTACQNGGLDINVLWYMPMPTINGHSVYSHELDKLNY